MLLETLSWQVSSLGRTGCGFRKLVSGPKTLEVSVGGNPRMSGSARGETYGALRYLTITLLATGTDKNGEFGFEDLNPGIYDVAVSFEASTLTKLRNLRVRKGHELEVHLTWEQPHGQICL